MKKKAQLKTGETIIILIIFFILLAGGMVFYAKIHTATAAQKAKEYQAIDANTIDQQIRHMAEIACTVDATVIFDCYDLYKIYGLQKTIQKYKLYYSAYIFKNSKVSITSVYPLSDSLVLYESEGLEEALGVVPYRTPVTIYNPITDTYNFGYITIEVS